MTVELRLIGSKKDLKRASLILYSALAPNFSMRNIYKGQKGDFVARGELVLEERFAQSASEPQNSPARLSFPGQGS